MSAPAATRAALGPANLRERGYAGRDGHPARATSPRQPSVDFSAIRRTRRLYCLISV